jgi:5-hydroxyisourate hydrolase-like protein (transthyretin family)
MTGKMSLCVHDDVHNQNADGIEYDLWRINDGTTRVNIGHDTITNNSPHVLVQANTAEELGSFEVILYVKDYFERFNENIDVQDSRYILPFGINELNKDNHLNMHITPTGYTCTL